MEGLTAFLLWLTVFCVRVRAGNGVTIHFINNITIPTFPPETSKTTTTMDPNEPGHCPPGCEQICLSVDCGRNLQDPFTIVDPRVVMSVVFIEPREYYESCLSIHEKRLMVSDIQLSKSYFRRFYSRNQLDMSFGVMFQRTTVNVGVQLSVQRLHVKKRSLFRISIPCLVPHVIFKYTYFYYPVKHMGYKGVVEIEFSDRPMTFGIILERSYNGECKLLGTPNLDFEQLKDYRVTIKFAAHTRHYLGGAEQRFNSLLEEGWLFDAYVTEIRLFSSRIIDETLKQRFGVVSTSYKLSKLCKTIRVPHSDDPATHPPRPWRTTAQMTTFPTVSYSTTPTDNTSNSTYITQSTTDISDTTEDTESSTDYPTTTEEIKDIKDISDTTDDTESSTDCPSTTEEITSPTDISGTTEDTESSTDCPSTTEEITSPTDISGTTEATKYSTDYLITMDEITSPTDISGTTKDSEYHTDHSSTTDEITNPTETTYPTDILPPTDPKCVKDPVVIEIQYNDK